MCGGIVCALSLSVKPSVAAGGPNWPFLLAYNAGRIISYSMAGLLAGLLGEVLLSSQLFPGLRTFMLLLASVFLLLLGLFTAKVSVLGDLFDYRRHNFAFVERRNENDSGGGAL